MAITDIVKFVSAVGEHTATAFQENFTIPQRGVPTRVPDGVPGFTSPSIVDGEPGAGNRYSKLGYELLSPPPHLRDGAAGRRH